MEELQQLIDLTEKGLTQVATQLGTTLPQLWEIMIKQQYVEAFQMFGVLIVSSISSYFFISKMLKAIKEEGEGMEVNEAKDFILMVGAAVSGMFLLLGILGSFEGIGQLINPEYYAIKDIVSQIGTLTNK